MGPSHRRLPLLLGALLLLASLAAAAVAGTAKTAEATRQGLEALLRLHGAEAEEAYRACRAAHGDTCQVPCKTIPGCAGCLPGAGGATVCGYALPGFILSADKKTTQACPAGSTSEGGRATECKPDGSAGKPASMPAQDAGQGARSDSDANACETSPCMVNGLPLTATCVDLPGNNPFYPGRRCLCEAPARPDLVTTYVENRGCILEPKVPTNDDSGVLRPATCRVLLDYPGATDSTPVGRTNPCPSAGTDYSVPTGVCRQVATFDVLPLAGMCTAASCSKKDATGCWIWAQVFYYRRQTAHSGWVLSGPTCAANEATTYLGPCPSPACPRPPSTPNCTVEADGGLTMRKAPCPSAPAITSGGAAVVIPQGVVFQYLDQNSRQTSACAAFGYSPEDASTCWVQGTFNGVTGWVPVATGDFIDPLCTLRLDASITTLVSDGGSEFGCARETEQADGCFPADATARLRSGASVAMSSLRVGDEVAVRKADGSMDFETVIAFGHQDRDGRSEFVELRLAHPTQDCAELTMQATAGHFVLTRAPGGNTVLHKRAGEVAAGDVMWVAAGRQGDNQLVEAVVVGTRTVVNTGLYVPVTLGGTIVVDGVAASVYGLWFADAAFAALGLPSSWLHHLYHAVLAPLRLLWRAFPRDYPHFYAELATEISLHRGPPSFVGLCAAIGRLASRLVIDRAAALLSSTSLLPSAAAGACILLAYVATSSSSRTGLPARERVRGITRQVPVAGVAVLLTCLCIVAAAVEPADTTSVKYADSYGEGPYAEEVELTYRKQHQVDPPEPVCLLLPPAYLLPGGTWDSRCHNVFEDRWCHGTCNKALGFFGSPKVQCTHDGWGTVVDNCILSNGCTDLPDIELEHARWPESCRGRPFNSFCSAECKKDCCNPYNVPSVLCGANGQWASTLAFGSQACDHSCFNLPPPIDYGSWPDSCRTPGTPLGGTCTASCTVKSGPSPQLVCTRHGYKLKAGSAASCPFYNGQNTECTGLCNSVCTDIYSNPDTCGGCTACPATNATNGCKAGTCCAKLGNPNSCSQLLGPKNCCAVAALCDRDGRCCTRTAGFPCSDDAECCRPTTCSAETNTCCLDSGSDEVCFNHESCCSGTCDFRYDFAGLSAAGAERLERARARNLARQPLRSEQAAHQAAGHFSMADPTAAAAAAAAAAAQPEHHAAAAPPATSEDTPSSSRLPPGWASLWDATYGRWYYVHAASGRSQWEAPSDAEAEAAAAAAAFHYYDPAGRLLGPFSRAQLAAWRGMLPMDLLLLTQDHPAVTAAASGAGAGAGARAGPAAAAARHAGSSSATLQLAELLGDSALLAHFKQSQAQQQQQQATSPEAAEPQQAQPQQPLWPPKAVAPPASVWKTWVDRHNSSQLGSDNGASDSAWPQTAAAAAAAAGASGPVWPGGGGMSSGGGGAAAPSSSAGSGSSSFERYAAAALQGLPPDDEAVQLAQHATAHGYSFSQVLQSYREAGAAAAADAAGAGGIRITQDGVEALMVKDPRSGRLSVAPGGTGAGASSAVELYGDLARWIAPEALEEALQKSSAARKRQQQQPYGAGAGPQAAVQRPGPAGAALLGDSKRARVALG